MPNHNNIIEYMKHIALSLETYFKPRDVTITTVRNPDYTLTVKICYKSRILVRSIKEDRIDMRLYGIEETRDVAHELRDDITEFILEIEQRSSEDLFARIAVGEAAPDRPTLPPPRKPKKKARKKLPEVIKRRYLEL